MTANRVSEDYMKRNIWTGSISIMAAVVMLVGVPAVSSAQVTDNDLDGINDALEITGGLTFANVLYPPCPAGTTIMTRHSCLSPTSKDIFVYLVTSTASGGFLAANNMITMSTPVNATQCSSTASTSCTGLFGFIAGPPTTTSSGKIDGLGVGVHVAVVTEATLPANRAVGLLGQQAVVMRVHEDAAYYAFGSTDQGTPSNTGRSDIWPVYIKNYVNDNVFNRVDTPSVWKVYIQRTGSHELSHATALTATKDTKLNQYHYKTGSLTVMDDSVVCSSRNGTCAIYNDYASGDIPCLLGLVSPTTNPLRCAPLPAVQ